MKKKWGKGVFFKLCRLLCSQQLVLMHALSKTHTCNICSSVDMLVFLCIYHYQWYSLTWTKRDATVFPPDAGISSVAPWPQWLIVGVPTEVYCCLQRTVWKVSRVGFGVAVRWLTIPSLTGVVILRHRHFSVIFLTKLCRLAIFSDWNWENNWRPTLWYVGERVGYSML